MNLRILFPILLLVVFACNKNSPVIPETIVAKTGEQFQIKVGQTVSFNNDLSFTFDSVPEDSRCPIGAVCFWSGNASVLLKSDDFTFKLNTTLSPQTISYGRYSLRLISLAPYPKIGEQIPKDSYVASMLVTVMEDSPIEISPLTVGTIKDSVLFTFTIPTTHFLLSDSLRGTFGLRNMGLTDRIFDFGNLQQLQYELVDDAGKTVLYQPVIVLPALSRLTLQPGQSKSYEVVQPFKDVNGNLIPAGSYTFLASLRNEKSPCLSLSIIVE